MAVTNKELRAVMANLNACTRPLRLAGIRPGDADDIRQEVAIAAWRALDRGIHWAGPGGLRAWLQTVTRRQVALLFVRAARRAEVAITDSDVPRTPSVEDEVLHREGLRLLEEALGEIAPPLRAVIEAHELDGVAVPEVARASGVPENTAYTRLRCARRRLRRAVRRIEARPHRGRALEDGR